MKRVIRNLNRGLRFVEEVANNISNGFQHYWNNFIECHLVIIKGYYDNSNEYPIGHYGPELITYGWNDYRGYRVDYILMYGDEIKAHQIQNDQRDDFMKFGFMAPNGDIYATHVDVGGNEYWEFLNRFLNILVPEKTSWQEDRAAACDWSRFIPVRWLGAYNTGVSVHKHSFEESLRHELQPNKREVAAQAVINFKELQAVCDHSPYTEDGLKYARVGILYSQGDCREVYYTDVWSRNIGQYLFPSEEHDTKYDTYENHIIDAYDGTLLYLAMMMSKPEKYFYEDEELLDFLEESFNYNLHRVSLYFSDVNKEIFEDIIMEAGYTYEEMEVFVKKFFSSSKGVRRNMAMTFRRELCDALDRMFIGSKPINYYGMYYGNTFFHNEGFVKVGSKPTAVVVRGRISNSSYEIVKRVAKEKNLEILHF